MQKLEINCNKYLFASTAFNFSETKDERKYGKHMCGFFYYNLKEMKHTINIKVFHSTDNVIVHVTMKQPDPHTLHGSKDSREEIANVFVVIADMFLFVNK